MAKRNVAAPEDKGATPVVSGDAAGGTKDTTRGFLQAARRNLTEEEASSPAGIRWLTHDAERLDSECGTLKAEIKDLRGRYDTLKDQHGEQRVELEQLRGAATVSGRNEWLSYLCFSAGSAGIGATPSYFNVNGATAFAIVVTVISGVLVVGGLLLRKWK